MKKKTKKKKNKLEQAKFHISDKNRPYGPVLKYPGLIERIQVHYDLYVNCILVSTDQKEASSKSRHHALPVIEISFSMDMGLKHFAISPDEKSLKLCDSQIRPQLTDSIILESPTP